MLSLFLSYLDRCLEESYTSCLRTNFALIFAAARSSCFVTCLIRNNARTYNLMDYVSKSHASWKEIRVTRVCSSWAREFFVRAMQVNKRELDQTGNRCSGIPARKCILRET